MIHDPQPTRLAAATERTSKSAKSYALSDSASLMPPERQTAGYIEPAKPISRIFADHSGMPISQIRSTRQAPSAILTEQYLKARASSGPVYVQNMSATRSERISNLYADAPRFRNQVDILA